MFKAALTDLHITETENRRVLLHYMEFMMTESITVPTSSHFQMTRRRHWHNGVPGIYRLRANINMVA